MLSQTKKIIIFRIAIVLAAIAIYVALVSLHRWSRRHTSPPPAHCVFRLHNIKMALERYRFDNDSYPPACTYDEEGKPMHSWRALILPYLLGYDHYKEYDYSEPWDGPNNSKLHDKMPYYFRCPNDYIRGKNCSSFMMVVDKNADPKREKERRFVLIIETNNIQHNWLEPVDFPIENFDLGMERGNSKDGKLRRLGKHERKLNAFKTIFGTATNHSQAYCISEDSEPESIQALARPDTSKKVKVTYPWGEDFGIQRVVLKEP